MKVTWQPPAEPSPGRVSAKRRGRLQRPNAAEGAATLCMRVATFRLDPDEETWKLLRLRASQAAAFRNKIAQARLADALGWRVPAGEERDPKPFRRNGVEKLVPFTLVKLVRERERGDLSSAVAVACETEVEKDWTRDGRATMAGKRLPQYSPNNIGIATISGRPGVQIHEDGAGGYVARLNITAQRVGPGWVEVPIHGGTKKDEFRMPLLHDFASGGKHILHARVVFRLHRGLTLLQLTYRMERPLAPMGGMGGGPYGPQRRATLSQLEDGRVVLRVDGWNQARDYTSRLLYLERLAQRDHDLRARLQREIGRRRGHARAKRKAILDAGFERHRDTLLHQWSRDIADWLQKQGVGQLTVIGLVGGSWAAHKLMQMLAYKCSEAGCKVVEHGEFDDPTVERAVKQEVRKKARKARKLAIAARTIIHEKGDDK